MVQIIWELAQCSLLELKPTLILYQWKNYRKIRAAVSLPIVVIGGINKGNAGRFKPMGIDGLAVVSAIIAQSDIKAAAAELKDLFCGKEKETWILMRQSLI